MSRTFAGSPREDEQASTRHEKRLPDREAKPQSSDSGPVDGTGGSKVDKGIEGDASVDPYSE